MPRFLPTLRRTLTRGSIEAKVVTPVAMAQYYAGLAGLNHSATRDWPIERAIAEGYDRVMWVFKSVDTIATDSAGLAYRLREGLDDDDPVVDDHPMYRLLNTGKANPLETGPIFRKRLSAQVLLSKKGAFVEVTKSNGGTPVRLDLLPPDRVQIIPGTGADLISHYELSLRTGGVRNLDPSKVRWFRNPHPIDPYMGTTPLESMGMSIELDHFARLYNVAFMQNDGRPGGVLAVRKTDGSGGDIDPKAMDRIEDKFGKGPQEAGKLSVIAGDLSYVDIAAKPRDMQYGATSRNAKIEILSGFGVGESVLGYAAERTFDNADNELYVYWTRTMPGHNGILLTGFEEDSEDGLHGFFDTSRVEILERTAKARRQEAREEVAAGVRSLYSYAQLAKIEDIESTPHTRALYIPSGKTPLPSQAADAEALGMGTPVDEPAGGAPAVEGGGAPPALPPGAPAPPDDTGGDVADGTAPPAIEAPAGGAAAAALRAVAGKSGLRAIEGGRPKVHVAYRLSRKAPDQVTESEPDEGAALGLEEDVAAILRDLTERWTSRAVARLSSPKARKGTRHWDPEYDTDTRLGTKALDTAKAVDEATWQAEAEEAVQPVLHAAAVAAATALLLELGVTPPPGYTLARMAADAVAQGVLAVVSAVGRAAANQATRLTGEVNRLDQSGEPLDGIVAAIRDRAARLRSWTEAVATFAATAITNGSRDDAAREANRDEGLEVDRIWFSRRDEVVRPSHRLADGQIRGLDEPFVVGESLMRFPCDPLAPVHEVANCRCRLRHRSRRTGRWVSPVNMKALPRDGDSDGFVYDGTVREMPAPLRTARGNERAIARGAQRVSSHARQAAGWHGVRLNKATGESWENVSRALSATFDTSFTTRTGRTVSTDAYLTVYAHDEDDEDEQGNPITVSSYGATGQFLDTESGEGIGSFDRVIHVSSDGEVLVIHEGMDVEEWAQGEGIASEFNAHAFAWYRHMGVTEVVVNASGSRVQNPKRRRMPDPAPDMPTGQLMTFLSERAKVNMTGGYVWGQQGFDWKYDSFLNTLPGTLLVAAEAEPGNKGGLPTELRRWDDLDTGEQVYLRDWMEMPFLSDDWWDDPDQRGLLADFIERTDYNRPPTPYEVNLLGADRPFTDFETGEPTWLGKAMMIRSSWLGRFDPRWLDVYVETKGRQSRTRLRILAQAMLASLGEDADTVETKSVRHFGSAVAHGAAALEARGWVRDGDGDGFIYDGTPRQQRAPVARGSIGRPWSEVVEAERRRRNRAAERPPVRAPRSHRGDTPLRPGESYLIKPGDPLPWDPKITGAEADARTLAASIEPVVTEHGNPGILDTLVRKATAYDDAMRIGDPADIVKALGDLLEVLAQIRDLRKASGEPMLEQEDLAAPFTRLANLSYARAATPPPDKG